MRKMTSYPSIEPGGGDTGTPLNLQKRLRLMQKHAPISGSKIIDCGCGTGQFLLALIGVGGDVYGVEYSAYKVARFQEQNPNLRERVKVGDVEAMHFVDSSFDVALLNEVLEHIPNDARALSEIYRVLRPKGNLILFSPNRLYPFETHGASLHLWGCKIPHYVPFVPYVPVRLGMRIFRYHARNYWPSELRRLVTNHGFTIIHTDYVWQTFENISGRQPKVVTLLRPLLRQLSAWLEMSPLIRVFGVSQVVIAQKA